MKRQRETKGGLEEHGLLRALIDLLPDYIYVKDARSRFVINNPAHARILGANAPEEVVGKTDFECFPRELAEQYFADDQQVMRSGQPLLNHEERVVDRTGCETWVSTTKVPLRNSRGDVVGLVGMSRDITERKRSEEAIRKYAAEFEDIYHNAPCGYHSLDKDGTFVGINNTELAWLGYSREELVGKKNFSDLLTEKSLEVFRRSFPAFKDRGWMRDLEFEMVRKDGTVLPVLLNATAVKDSAGNYVQSRSTLFDISGRRRAEEERDRFFNLSIDLLCIAGFDGRFKRLNPAWETTLGYKAEDLLARPYLEFVHPEDVEATVAAAQKLVEGGVIVSFENRYRAKDGSYRWLLWASAPDREREVIYAVARDITDRKRVELDAKALNELLEERARERTAQLETANRELQNEIVERQRLSAQLFQSQKMEAVGRLAGGVAHDFNNLLTVITGYAELLLGRLGPDGPQRNYVEEIKKAGDRAASLTRQLLAFGRRQVMMPQVLDLNAVVANMDKMLRRLIGEDIDLVAVLGTDLGRVKADPGQLEQVIMNLAVNARDAMLEGGKLTIETANADLDENYARGQATVIPGPYVMLAASDTGHGMDAETQSHIFEPFFTTKEPGKGTGLGLATVYGIVKQTGGYIWVYSEPEKGATFKIYLPRVGEKAETAEAVKPSAAPRQGSETILLVEDEPAVRALARQVLESQGYRVLQARHGDDALIVADQHRGPIQLLLTDVVMPGMNGRDLADRLAPFHREMKVLFISGYTDTAVIHHGVLEKNAAFLQKPFTPDALVRKVREVLDKH